MPAKSSVEKNMAYISMNLSHFHKQLYNLANVLESFYDKGLERTELGGPLKEMLEETDQCLQKLVGSIGYPISKEAKDAVGGAYRMFDRQMNFLRTLKSYKDRSDKHMPLPRELDPYIDSVLSTERYIKASKELERQNLHYLERVEKIGQELPSMPKKRNSVQDDSAEAMTAAGKLVAMIAFVALGFVMLNGLDNMQAASSAGALPSLNTGFFLLPGGPFVSSLQMLLFMLSAAVAVMYLAGKALGEW